MKIADHCLALVLAASLTGSALAQTEGAEMKVKGLRADPEQPVEVTAETLTVNQTDGTAVFEGNVIVVQGDMKMTAPQVTVHYDKEDQSTIERITATGGVTLVSPDSAAEARDAVYTIESGVVVMTGAVLLNQGPSTMSGDKLTVDLDDGTGRMEGGVKTILVPKGKKRE
jgi:lipopolysaccharide export system protein LptA